MKWLIPILLVFTSCSPEMRLARLLKHHPSLPYVDTTTLSYNSVNFRDTIIFRQLPGDTVFREVKISIPAPPGLHYGPVFAKTTLASAKAWITDNTLKIRLIQNDTLFRFKLDSAIRANRQTVIKTKIVEKPIPPRPFWKNGFFVLAGVVTLMILFLVLRK